jgi:hypothetical protein
LDKYQVDVDLRLLGHPIESPLALLLLHLERDALDRPALNTLDEMGSKPSDLIPETLGGNLGNFGEYLLIDMEIIGKFLVVFLQQHLGSTLDCFGSDAAHCGIKIIIFIKSK